jgi:hypothetical protein
MPEPLTEGSLEKPCLDGLLVVALANHRNAVITEQCCAKTWL